RATFPDGWALVRASNTGPNLTVRFESKSQEGLDAIEAEIKAVLGKHVETW
ncbi:MAG: phosphomannomutase, partial [Chloroflexi bacterium]|nr:phosphomannomutase [Chloroflexota bacterium]